MQYVIILHNDDGQQFETVPHDSLAYAYHVANGWFDGDNRIVRYEIFDLNGDGTLGLCIDQRDDD